MELNFRCPQCGKFLEGFTVVKEDSDWKKGEFVIVCYSCRAPDGGLQPYVDFGCKQCERTFDPQILEIHHRKDRTEEILCPNCHRIKTYGRITLPSYSVSDSRRHRRMLRSARFATIWLLRNRLADRAFPYFEEAAISSISRTGISLAALASVQAELPPGHRPQDLSNHLLYESISWAWRETTKKWWLG